MQADAATSGLEVRVLGALEVMRSDRTIRIGSAKERTVLVMLALQAGRMVSCDRLCDVLWADSPPASPRTTLQSLISRLRRKLAGESGRCDKELRTSDPGWVLDVELSSVDALRFYDLTARARHQSALGDVAEAATGLQAAVGLWRGAALVDVVDAGYLQAQATRLDQARLDAIEDLAEAKLATGRPAEALFHLEGHVDVNPLRERAWVMLMLALCRVGQRGAALRAFDQARSVLGEELGLDPSPELSDLERRIVRHDPSLAGPPGPDLPDRPLAGRQGGRARPRCHR